MKSLTILLTFSAGFLLVICEDYTDSEEQRINEFLEEVNKNMTEAKTKEQPVPVPVTASIGSVVSPKADQTYGMGNCNRCINIDFGGRNLPRNFVVNYKRTWWKTWSTRGKK